MISLVFLLLFFLFNASSAVQNSTNGGIYIRGIELPQHPSFNSVTSAKPDCRLASAPTPEPTKSPPLKLQLKRKTHQSPPPKKDSLAQSTHRDLHRLHNLHRRILERKNTNPPNPNPSAQSPSPSAPQQQMVATLESGLSLGSGEYFMDVFVGTPPKHFSLILDTGSDLNWLQCLPCHDCFDQTGPVYDPNQSSSYRNVTCRDPRCALVSAPDSAVPCAADHQPCPYFYWYGDRSNTTGDFATETFTVNLTGSGASASVEGFMFGCGHWNRGLFHGAAGLLGLGRGPLSFASQMRSLYGHAFSYCLVDRDADLSVSSKLVFGEDPGLLAHPNLNYTSFVAGSENPVDTFYYVDVKTIMVGGEAVQIPADALRISAEGAGGTIIDSGTTLSYFAEPVYEAIRAAFVRKIKKYEAVDGFLLSAPCYNVTGVAELELPGFALVFGDGAMWDFPVENYFIRMEPHEVVCLAMLGVPRDSLSIIGNYQQQNFHIMYDVQNSRLGYAPRKCADV
ncbi:Protein ASPARTIC PROTEASE IN GUARD CELL 1 [Acorus calamus]|uniref:Protein ASPARTIC PROTEASE IN GUARD CELL 1 n=1 Tax=Acorus calamus TaxID=4465 RepID=A0AAV9DBT1_ACOCL|nr:Protein ASPARTIC PROTEASE IN GUARD CELL 1 [Acorus calamus]